MNFFVAQLDDIAGTWVVDHKTLAKRYLMAWFTIDFVSSRVACRRVGVHDAVLSVIRLGGVTTGVHLAL